MGFLFILFFSCFNFSIKLFIWSLSVFLILLKYFSVSSWSSLSFLKTFVLNSLLSRLYIFNYLGLVTGTLFCSFDDVMFSWLFLIPVVMCWCLQTWKSGTYFSNYVWESPVQMLCWGAPEAWCSCNWWSATRSLALIMANAPLAQARSPGPLRPACCWELSRAQGH